ncbi:J-type co-chaperone jac1, mitochondrial [Ceratocystis fimbriata CBS 114723]|uniref:J-type co-chaperone jac1, mitochondrial n=1 Tax=Ceratocystis fimbriata CBS 114723 TaxID=1035309 RepID=A0A2C5WZB5_9PEZI|nr:J-type co-chaperone jac1, mitochondrial [Ceratocystis fimbriata CBS 114723]
MTCRLLHHSPGCCRPADSNSKGPHSSIPPSPEVKTKAESTAPPTTSSAPRTHYDIFPETLPQGPPPHGHFPVDVRALRREFLRLQAQAHPDLHPAKDKVRAQSMSALINTAFKTLSNPLLRAQYLLGLRGINPGEDEQARVDDPALLMTVMEAHEQIQEAKMEADLKSLNEENEERIKVSENILEKAFKEDAIQAAVEESVRLRYWVNIRDSIHNWEPGKPGTVQH